MLAAVGLIRSCGNNDRRKGCREGPWRAAHIVAGQAGAELSSPPKQLLRPQPVLPRHFGDNSAWLLAFRHNARLRFRRPTASSADTRDRFDALQTFRNALSALKRMLGHITSRCLLMGRHYGHAKLILEGGKQSPLTLRSECPNVYVRFGIPVRRVNVAA